MTQNDTLAGGVQPRPQTNRHTLQLLALRRQLEDWVARCHDAAQEYDPEEQAAALAAIRAEIEQVLNGVN